MLDTKALLVAAAAIAGFAAAPTEADALTPLSMDLAIDPSVAEGPSEHATLAPVAFERAPDEAYEPVARVTNRRARNWLNAGEITRDVPVRDVSEAGDWSEVQVWNIPTRQWGVRRYNVQGFILNVLTAEAQAQAAALAQQASASASEAAIPVG
jgi:hypothetical protein